MHRQDRNEDEDSLSQIPPPPPSPPAAQRHPTHEANKHEMEKAINVAKEDESEHDISIKSVLEMGYSKTDVDFAVEELRKRGKSTYTATDLMEIILDREERQTATTTNASTTTTATTTPSATSFPTRPEASVASSDSESLLKENETLKHQMLCKICLDKDACVVYLPCGHMVTCQDSAPTIRKCCICRKMILGTVKAYL